MFTKAYKRFIKLVCLILAMSILSIGWQIALADDDDWDDDDVLPLINPAEFSGNIRVDGDATVSVLIQEAADRFIADGFRGQINIVVSNTASAYSRFCDPQFQNDQTHLVMANRRITDNEEESCRLWRDPIDFRLGMSGNVPLLVYSERPVLNANHSAAAFLAYIIDNSPTLTAELGFTPPTRGQLAYTIEEWVDAIRNWPYDGYVDDDDDDWYDDDDDWYDDDDDDWYDDDDDWYDDDDDWYDDDDVLPNINPAEFSGNIRVDGDATVSVLIQEAADRFIADGFQGQINIVVSNTASAYSRFCDPQFQNDQTHLVMANRRITEQEEESCRLWDDPLDFRLGASGNTPLFIYSEAPVLNANHSAAAFLAYIIDNSPTLTVELGFTPPTNGQLAYTIEEWVDAINQWPYDGYVDDDDDWGDDDDDDYVTPEVTETEEATPDVTAEATADVTAEATADVTAEPTADVTAEPTADVTAEPTADVTAEPTADMTETVVATEDPTSTGTPEVTATETVVVVTQDPDNDDDDDTTATPTPANPTAITVIYPADDAYITQVSEYQTRIQWLPVDGAQWYHVFLMEDDDDDDDDDATIFYNTWYPATDEIGASNGLVGVCDEALCQTTVDLWLSNDDYVLWIGYWSESLGPDYTQTYTAFTFEIDFDDPEVPTNAQVQPATDQSNAALIWDADDHTLWYRIWFGPADYSETIVFQWFAAQDICNAETCMVELPNSPVEGDYELWMELWGPDEYERWERVAEITVTP